MEKLKRVIVAAFFFLFSLHPIGVISAVDEAQSEPEISMDFQDANLKDILKIFSMQAGLNFIASEAVQDRKITLYLDKVPLNRAMDLLFKANNLSFDLNKEANIFVVKDWGKLEVETVTRIFRLKYTSVSSAEIRKQITDYGENEESSSSSSTTTSTSTSSTSSGEDYNITKAIEKVVSENGKVSEDPRTNSLIVTDTPGRMQKVEAVIAALDIPVAQVMLEVEMLDVSKNTVDAMGFKFGQTPLSVAIKGTSAPTGFPFKSWDKVSALGDIGTGTINMLNASTATQSYTVQLDWLRTNTDTKYLARPRVLTLDNETAEIQITTQETVGKIEVQQGQGESSSTTTSAERVVTGVSLKITPQVDLEHGEVTMFINPKVMDTTAATIYTTQYRDPEERSTKSVVRVKDGETVILGGLIRKEKTEVITKLPILGDLPLVGRAFRHKDKTKDKERELLVFITPRIIKEKPLQLAQSNKTPLPVREQDTASGASREALVSSSLNNFEKKK